MSDFSPVQLAFLAVVLFIAVIITGVSMIDPDL